MGAACPRVRRGMTWVWWRAICRCQVIHMLGQGLLMPTLTHVVQPPLRNHGRGHTPRRRCHRLAGPCDATRGVHRGAGLGHAPAQVCACATSIVASIIIGVLWHTHTHACATCDSPSSGHARARSRTHTHTVTRTCRPFLAEELKPEPGRAIAASYTYLIGG